MTTGKKRRKAREQDEETFCIVVIDTAMNVMNLGQRWVFIEQLEAEFVARGWVKKEELT